MDTCNLINGALKFQTCLQSEAKYFGEKNLSLTLISQYLRIMKSLLALSIETAFLQN